MEVNRSEKDGVIVLALAGEFDLYNVRNLNEVLEGESLGSDSLILLDLGRVSYIDSTGLGSILGLYKKVQGGSGRIAVARPAANVHDMLKVTKVVRFLKIYDSVDRAIMDMTAR